MPPHPSPASPLPASLTLLAPFLRSHRHLEASCAPAQGQATGSHQDPPPPLPGLPREASAQDPRTGRARSPEADVRKQPTRPPVRERPGTVASRSWGRGRGRQALSPAPAGARADVTRHTAAQRRAVPPTRRPSAPVRVVRRRPLTTQCRRLGAHGWEGLGETDAAGTVLEGCWGAGRASAAPTWAGAPGSSWRAQADFAVRRAGPGAVPGTGASVPPRGAGLVIGAPWLARLVRPSTPAQLPVSISTVETGVWFGK